MNKTFLFFKTAKIKLLNWEYWNFNLVYFPVFFYWLWLSIKARSFFFFSTSNPSIQNAGFAMESKKSIYDLLPHGFYPKTILISPGTDLNTVSQLLSSNNMHFPLVGKPDIGERGMAVKKLNNLQEVELYISGFSVNLLLQEWCSYPMEAGIFYCRYPNAGKGFISGIVSKEFMHVKGTGDKTIEELILATDRFVLQYDVLRKTMPDVLSTILPKDEIYTVVPYGNHCRGTRFTDAGFRINRQLEETIEHVCSRINGFYFGRLDIRFESWELLEQGRNFSIIELNGAGSEPTHIYDPSHSIWFAWKEIIRHLNILYSISKQNKQKYQAGYMSFREGLHMLKAKKRYNRLLSQSVI